MTSQGNFYCMYYIAIHPLRESISDNANRIPDIKLNIIDLDGSDYEVCILCDTKNHPELLRIKIPNLLEEIIPESKGQILQSIKEHMLSCLKLIYDTNTSFAYPSIFYAFFKNETPYNINLKITEQVGEAFLNKENLKNLFLASFNTRELLRLYADGINEGIPLQYRFLSFYKILESRFKIGGKWEKNRLNDAINAHMQKFKDLNISKAPLAKIHELRDKCAHLKVGKNIKNETLGVTHLNLKEAVQVELILPILRDICAIAINERVGGAYSFATEMPPKEFKRATE